MYLQRRNDDGFTIINDYGSFDFKNMQKYYKFQLLCPHPSSSIMYEKVYCDRCGLLLPEIDNKSIQVWENEGGPAIDR